MALFYRRNLPHWQPDKSILFVTFRLFGSLPQSTLDSLQQERDRLRRIPARPGESPRERALREGKRLFGFLDTALGKEAANPQSISAHWLADEHTARIVRDSMLFFEGVRYREHRYVIMPNHVHWLVEPLPRRPENNTHNTDLPRSHDFPNTSCWPIGMIMKSLKGYTARTCNAVLGLQGSFWQDESGDHWVRDKDEYDRIVSYIDENPVKAGLCSTPAQWRWSTTGEQAEREQRQ